MKITKITVWALDLPLSKPYFLSGGRLKFERLDSTFVRVETDQGLAGWGEGCPWGHSYLPASGPGIRAGLEVIAPALIGQDPLALETINRLMDAVLPGHLYVKSAIDIACWDLLGQVSGLPLWRLLGAAEPPSIALNSSISTGDPDAMVALIQAARAQGYRTHSAKIGGHDRAADIARINGIEAALAPGEQVTFDVNRAWTPGVAVAVLNAVNSVSWVEQPCESLEQCAHVAARVSQPIMLDECLHEFADHLRALALQAGEGIKLKPNRVGGLTKARRIRDLAIHAGWQMHVEDVGGTALADTAAFHLAASVPEENRLASWLAHAHLRDDPVPGQGVRNSGGAAVLPACPGLGVTPNPDELGTAQATYGERL